MSIYVLQSGIGTGGVFNIKEVLHHQRTNHWPEASHTGDSQCNIVAAPIETGCNECITFNGNNFQNISYYNRTSATSPTGSIRIAPVAHVFTTNLDGSFWWRWRRWGWIGSFSYRYINWHKNNSWRYLYDTWYGNYIFRWVYWLCKWWSSYTKQVTLYEVNCVGGSGVLSSYKTFRGSDGVNYETFSSGLKIGSTNGYAQTGTNQSINNSTSFRYESKLNHPEALYSAAEGGYYYIPWNAVRTTYNWRPHGGILSVQETSKVYTGVFDTSNTNQNSLNIVFSSGSGQISRGTRSHYHGSLPDNDPSWNNLAWKSGYPAAISSGNNRWIAIVNRFEINQTGYQKPGYFYLDPTISKFSEHTGCIPVFLNANYGTYKEKKEVIKIYKIDITETCSYQLSNYFVAFSNTWQDVTDQAISGTNIGVGSIACASGNFDPLDYHYRFTTVNLCEAGYGFHTEQAGKIKPDNTIIDFVPIGADGQTLSLAKREFRTAQDCFRNTNQTKYLVWDYAMRIENPGFNAFTEVYDKNQDDGDSSQANCRIAGGANPTLSDGITAVSRADSAFNRYDSRIDHIRTGYHWGSDGAFGDPTNASTDFCRYFSSNNPHGGPYKWYRDKRILPEHIENFRSSIYNFPVSLIQGYSSENDTICSGENYPLEVMKTGCRWAQWHQNAAESLYNIRGLITDQGLRLDNQDNFVNTCNAGNSHCVDVSSNTYKTSTRKYTYIDPKTCYSPGDTTDYQITDIGCDYWYSNCQNTCGPCDLTSTRSGVALASLTGDTTPIFKDFDDIDSNYSYGSNVVVNQHCGAHSWASTNIYRFKNLELIWLPVSGIRLFANEYKLNGGDDTTPRYKVYDSSGLTETGNYISIKTYNANSCGSFPSPEYQTIAFEKNTHLAELYKDVSNCIAFATEVGGSGFSGVEISGQLFCNTAGLYFPYCSGDTLQVEIKALC